MKFRHHAKLIGFGFGALALAACTPPRPNDPAEVTWQTDAEKAVALSRQVGKPLLIGFFGSDWSAASQAAQKEVLDTVAFKDFSDANLVLLKVDFPRKGTTPANEKAYDELALGLHVDHLPVFFLADPANGQGPFRRLDSGPAGPTEFVNNIETALSEYRNSLAARPAQTPAPMAAPPKLPQASGAGGFPSSQDLANRTQGQRGGPPPAINPVGLPQSQPGQNLPSATSSGFPPPEDLLKPSPAAPAGTNPAPAQGTDAPMLQLK
jgi:hypothetical protein